jgi:hypothetical protein
LTAEMIGIGILWRLYVSRSVKQYLLFLAGVSLPSLQVISSACFLLVILPLPSANLVVRNSFHRKIGGDGSSAGCLRACSNYIAVN